MKNLLQIICNNISCIYYNLYNKTKECEYIKRANLYIVYMIFNYLSSYIKFN